MAWNEAVQTIIQKFFDVEDIHLPQILYAAVLTVLAVFVIALFQRLDAKVKDF